MLKRSIDLETATLNHSSKNKLEWIEATNASLKHQLFELKKCNNDQNEKNVILTQHIAQIESNNDVILQSVESMLAKELKAACTFNILQDLRTIIILLSEKDTKYDYDKQVWQHQMNDLLSNYQECKETLNQTVESLHESQMQCDLLKSELETIENENQDFRDLCNTFKNEINQIDEINRINEINTKNHENDEPLYEVDAPKIMIDMIVQTDLLDFEQAIPKQLIDVAISPISFIENLSEIKDNNNDSNDGNYNSILRIESDHKENVNDRMDQVYYSFQLSSPALSIYDHDHTTPESVTQELSFEIDQIHPTLLHENQFEKSNVLTNKKNIKKNKKAFVFGAPLFSRTQIRMEQRKQFDERKNRHSKLNVKKRNSAFDANCLKCTKHASSVKQPKQMKMM